MKIRVLIVDDHQMVREALRSRIDQEDDLEVVAEAGSGGDALQQLDRTSVDIALLDIAMPGLSGIDTARSIHVRHPDVAMVAVTGYTDRLFVDEMMQAGARGYVSKSSGTQELVTAIRSVVQGKRYLCSEATNVLFAPFTSADGASVPRASVLTPRERQVLTAIAQGSRAAAISADLGISIATVEVHRRNIKAKLGVRTTAELTRYAVREGLTNA